MKNTILIFLSIVYTGQILAESPAQKKLFSGSIEFPCAMDFDLCLFYKGEKLLIETHQTTPLIEYNFTDTKNTHTMFLIITDGVTYCPEIANTVEGLQIIPEHKYIGYQLLAQREIDDFGQELLTWKIFEHTLEKNIIPLNSVIFLFDPSLIAGLKVQSWKPENMFRCIPTILIKQTATKQELSRAMDIARLAALDIDALHVKSAEAKSTSAILTAMHDTP